MRVDYIETVWNSYQVFGYPDDIDFEKILKEKYNGNIWQMAEDYTDMRVELSESCFDFIDTDYDKVEVS